MAKTGVQLSPAVIAALAQGRMLDAIRMMRETQDMSLKDAHALMQRQQVFQAVDNQTDEASSLVKSSPAKTAIKLGDDVKAAVARGDLLEAIGLLRNANPRLDLASAKDVIDDIRARTPKHHAAAKHQQRVPTVVEGDRGDHAWLVVVVVAIIAAVAWWLGIGTDTGIR